MRPAIKTGCEHHLTNRETSNIIPAEQCHSPAKARSKDDLPLPIQQKRSAMGRT